MCSAVRTHEHPRRGLMAMVPGALVPVTTDDMIAEGAVYKGMCLSCHGGLRGAKAALGEGATDADVAVDAERARAADARRGKRKKKKRRPKPPPPGGRPAPPRRPASSVDVDPGAAGRFPSVSTLGAASAGGGGGGSDRQIGSWEEEALDDDAFERLTWDQSESSSREGGGDDDDGGDGDASSAPYSEDGEALALICDASDDGDYRAVLNLAELHRTSAAAVRAACEALTRAALVQGGAGDGGGGDGGGGDDGGDDGDGGGGGVGARILPETWAEVLTRVPAPAPSTGEGPGRPRRAAAAAAAAAAIQSEVLRTVWTVASSSDSLRSEAYESGAAEFALESVDAFGGSASVRMYGCGLVGCLAGSVRDAARAGGALLRAAARSRGGDGDDGDGNVGDEDGGRGGGGGGADEDDAASELALRALCYLALSSRTRSGPGEEGAGRFLSEMTSPESVRAIARTARRRARSSPGAQVWAFRLLWVLLSAPPRRSGGGPGGSEDEAKEPDGDGDGDGGGAPPPELPGDVVGDVASAVSASLGSPGDGGGVDPSVAEAAAGLLSALSAARSRLPYTPADASALAEAAASAMRSRPADAPAQRYGCLAMSNLCRPRERSDSDGGEGEVRSAVARSGGIECAIRAVDEHPTDSVVLTEACLALAAMCVGSDANKDAAIEAGGLDRVVSAYRSQVGEAGGRAEEARDAAATAFAALATREGRAAELNRSGFMVELLKAALEGSLLMSSSSPPPSSGGPQDRRDGPPLAMLNLLAVNCSAGDGPARTAATSTVARLLLADCRTEEEAERAISLLRGLTRSSRECAAALAASSCGGTGGARPSSSALDMIAEVAGSYPRSASLQEGACRLLSNLYALLGGGHRPPDDAVGLGIEAEVISAALRNHPRHDGVAEAACLALRNLCCVYPPSVVVDDDGGIFEVLTDTVGEAVRAAAAAGGWSTPARESLAGLIWAVATAADAPGEVLASMGGDVGVIIDMVSDDGPGTETMRREAAGALSALCSVPETCRQIGSRAPRVVDAVVRCMDENDADEDALAAGCTILAGVSSDGCDDSFEIRMAMLEDDSSVRRVVGSMMRFPASAAVQGPACEALAHLAATGCTEDAVVSLGGIGLVVRAVDDHRGDPTVVTGGCEALASLVAETPNDILRGNDVVRCVLSAMRAHPDLVGAQESCMTALWTLSIKGEEFRDDVVRCQGLQDIVGSMQEHVGSEAVQEKGCVTLWSLAISEANQAEIGRIGGVGAIVNGAMAHINSLQVQLSSIGVLQTLACNPENKELIQAGGVTELIVNAMWVHYSNPTLQASACSALSNAAVDAATNQVVAIGSNELEAIVSAMRKFPEDETLQTQACVLLRNFTFEPSNVALMGENALLVDLLMTSSRNFPDACSERVEYIINRIFGG